MAYKGLACKKHKKYKAMRWPKCYVCMELYDLKEMHNEIKRINLEIADQIDWLKSETWAGRIIEVKE